MSFDFLGYWGVSLIGLAVGLLLYQIVAGRLLRIWHHWIPMFWVFNYFIVRKEKSGHSNFVYWIAVMNLCYAPVILHMALRTFGAHHPIADEFGIWKVASAKFSFWLPILTHAKLNLTILSCVCWWFWFHCSENLLVRLYFPTVILTEGLKIGNDKEGRLVSLVKWSEMKFLHSVNRFLFFKTPNPASRHTMPIAIRHNVPVLVNLAQEPMFGFVGGTNSGKTSAVSGFCSSIATIDEHTFFIFCDIVKNGSQYRIFECDPSLVFSPLKPETMNYAQWQRKQSRLPNVLVVDNEATFSSTVDALEYEIEYRRHILTEHYGKASLYDLEDPRQTKIEKADIFNPPRIFRIFMVVDDWAVIRDEYKKDEVAKATNRLLEMVSFARYVKVHILFITQKATIMDYFPGAARDQIFWMGFALTENQSEYVLKQKINLPNALGVCGYVGSGVHSKVGIGCTPYLSPLDASMVFTRAAGKIVITDWGKKNCERMLAFRARCEADAGAEVMERLSQGQRELLTAQVLA